MVSSLILSRVLLPQAGHKTQRLFLDVWFSIILYRYYIQQAVYIFFLSLQY